MIQFQAGTQTSGEMEGGDTNAIYGVMDSVGTAYIYMTNMIQTLLATGFLHKYILSFQPGRIWAFSYSPLA